MIELAPPTDLAAVAPATQGIITEDVVRSGITRETPKVDPSRSALVGKWQSKIKLAKSKWANDTKRMKEDQRFLRGAQWEGKENPDKYTANIIQRHVNQRVAALYAKNPKVVVRRRKTMDFREWDESSAALEALQMAVSQSMQTGMPLPPQAVSLVTDIGQGIERKKMLQKISDTLQIIYDYTLNEQLPPFKLQMKQLVRRVCACGVGYVKLGYTRIMERRPEDVEQINGLTEQISRLHRLISDNTDDKLAENSAELEEMRILLADYQSREEEISREGISFDFPPATSIIIDPACRHLRTFTGARWLAEEYILTTDDIKEIYGVDLSCSGATNYSTESREPVPGLKEAVRQAANGTPTENKVEGTKVWVIWDKSAGQTCTIAEGYPDFLVEPKQPDVFLKRFWPIFPLTFNESEDEEGLFPRSDVHLLRSMQLEYNRSREGLRQHRVANRPCMAVANGAIGDDDIEVLTNRPANAVIKLNALAPGDDIRKLLQPLAGSPIEAELYDTSAIFEDVMRVIGQSDASLGAAQSGVTATGDSIAEQNRTVSLASNVDDLDDMLIELSRAAGQIFFGQMSKETATKIAGPGAVWPELSAQEISDELLLEIEAGSSGRPNKAAEIANIERLTPLFLQIPGVKPDWLLRQLVVRLDDKIDLSEAMSAGLPSMVVMNAMSKMAQDQSQDPAQQAGQAAASAPQTASPSGPPASPAALPVLG